MWFQFLFWSKTRWMMEAYTTLMENVYTLEDTLVGYVFNQLVWCGHLQHTGGVGVGEVVYCPTI